MKFLDSIASRLGYTKATLSKPVQPAMTAQWSEAPMPRTHKRDYAATIQDWLTEDWNASTTTADSEIRAAIKPARSRSRELERNNDFAKRYKKLLVNNVLGSNGIGLQMKIREPSKSGGLQYDTAANRFVEDAWWKWGSRKFASLNRMYSWRTIQELALVSAAFHGSVFARKHYPRNNPFRFALELIEADQLDTDYSATMPGRVVRLGVEYSDSTGEPLFYHVLRHHPGDNFQPRFTGDAAWREPIPANQIIHLFAPERIGQSIGMPWLMSSMLSLKHLGAYTEAEVIAARIGAAKMGFLEDKDGMAPVEYTGAEIGDGGQFMEVSPGSIERLPRGKQFKAFDPTHPTTAFGDFVKAKLREIAAGLGVSYTSLANDLEGVNYSSIRAGLLEEREEWKTVQGWFIESFVQPVFDSWLEMALTVGAVGSGSYILPASKLDKFNAPEWKPRRWPWVDPLKDMQANVLAVEKGFGSRRAIIAEGGGDIEDTFTDIAEDEALAEEKGLDFSVDSGEQANAQQSKPDAPDDVDKTKGGKDE